MEIAQAVEARQLPACVVEVGAEVFAELLDTFERRADGLLDELLREIERALVVVVIVVVADIFVVLRDIGLFGFLSMMVFLAILVVGFLYEWKKGALEWE